LSQLAHFSLQMTPYFWMEPFFPSRTNPKFFRDFFFLLFCSILARMSFSVMLIFSSSFHLPLPHGDSSFRRFSSNPIQFPRSPSPGFPSKSPCTNSEDPNGIFLLIFLIGFRTFLKLPILRSPFKKFPLLVLPPPNPPFPPGIFFFFPFWSIPFLSRRCSGPPPYKSCPRIYQGFPHFLSVVSSIKASSLLQMFSFL